MTDYEENDDATRDLSGNLSNDLSDLSYLAGLDNRERRFVLEYVKDSKAGPAVLRCGFTDNVDSAYQIGSRLLRNVKVSKAIDLFFAECTMSAAEAVKNVSDIARSNLNDYMVVRPVQAVELVPTYVTVLLERTNDEIERIREFIKAEGLEEKGGGSFKRQIRKLQEKKLEYMGLIETYGKLVELLAPGQPIITERMELDMVALAKDKERGRVKTLQPTEFGYKVEMYPADANLERVLKYHGKLPELMKHTGADGGAIEHNHKTQSTVTIVDTTGSYKVPAPDDDYNNPDAK